MKEQAGIGPWELMCRKGHGGEKDLGAFHLSLKSPTCWNLGALLQRCLKPPPTFSSVDLLAHLPEGRNAREDPFVNRSGWCRFVHLSH